MYTDYDALESAIYKLKNYARHKSLFIGIPHGIACGLAGGDWEKVGEITGEVFDDYPVTIYMLK